MRILKFPFSTPFLSTKTEHSKLVLLFEPKILIPLPIIEVFCNSIFSTETINLVFLFNSK